MWAYSTIFTGVSFISDDNLILTLPDILHADTGASMKFT